MNIFSQVTSPEKKANTVFWVLIFPIFHESHMTLNPRTKLPRAPLDARLLPPSHRESLQGTGWWIRLLFLSNCAVVNVQGLVTFLGFFFFFVLTVMPLAQTQHICSLYNGCLLKRAKKDHREEVCDPTKIEKDCQWVCFWLMTLFLSCELCKKKIQRGRVGLGLHYSHVCRKTSHQMCWEAQHIELNHSRK